MSMLPLLGGTCASYRMVGISFSGGGLWRLPRMPVPVTVARFAPSRDQASRKWRNMRKGVGKPEFVSRNWFCPYCIIP